MSSIPDLKELSQLPSWPPVTGQSQHTPVYTRTYFDQKGMPLNSSLRGERLPSHQRQTEFDALLPSEKKALFASTQLFTDLPPVFFERYLQIQNSPHPIETLPKMNQDKHISVWSSARQSRNFSRHFSEQERGVLRISQWRQLGWPSEQAYVDWLNSSMLFAFSHCMHYCSASRVFEHAPGEHKAGKAIFRETKANIKDSKKTNILSVVGFEFRGYSGPISETSLIRQAGLTVEHILDVATKTSTKHIVLIPYGMGVFLPDDQKARNRISAYLLKGMKDGFKNYQGPPITIHCCAGFLYENFNGCNDRITFVNQHGKDAYTLANYLEDFGSKSMLINAGDNDWTAGLDPRRVPGQCALGHTLFDTTSDEYYALMTQLALHSIQNLIKCLGSLTGKITQTKQLSVIAEETLEEKEALWPKYLVIFLMAAALITATAFGTGSLLIAHSPLLLAGSLGFFIIMLILYLAMEHGSKHLKAQGIASPEVSSVQSGPLRPESLRPPQQPTLDPSIITSPGTSPHPAPPYSQSQPK